MEAVLDDDPLTSELLPADCVELVPFATFKRLLSRGPLLEAYPAKPSRLDLRARGIGTDSAAAASQVVTNAIAGLSTRGTYPSPPPIKPAMPPAANVAAVASSPADPFETYLRFAATSLTDDLV